MATNTAVADLNRVQYVGLDFPTHFDDLRSELQTKFAADFNDFALSSLAIMLLDLTAYGLDTLSFYLDRRASDAYLETAQTRKAVARLTRQLGYKMGGAVSSSTDLAVRITTPVNFIVTLPQGFQFRGPNGLIFEVAEAVSYDPNSTVEKLVPVYEGESVTESFIGDGSANQSFQLRAVPVGKSVVQGSVKVLVNGATYTEAAFLPVIGGQYFEVGYNDDPATLRFGDGTVSQNDIPAPSATISVTYIASAGLAGQVSANTITTTVNPLVINTVTVPLTITNPEAAVGGDDPETLDRAKILAPLVYKSRQVAVTQSDYVSLATAFADPLFGRVAVAQALAPRSGESDLELQTLLQDVRDTLEPIQAAVTAQVDLVQAQAEIATNALTTVSTSSASITTESTTVTSALEATRDTYLQPATATVSLASSQCTTGAVTVSSIPAASGISIQTTSPYAQVPLNGSVLVTVTSVTGLTIGQTVQVSTGGMVTGGTYTVATVPTTNSVLLVLVTAGTVPYAATVDQGSELSSVPTDALTTATASKLQRLFSDINTNLGAIGSAGGYIPNALNQIGAALDASTAIEDANVVVLAAVPIAQNAVTTIDTTLSSAIVAAVQPLTTSGAATGTVNVDLQAISDHVGAILSSNCSANLVTVPILTNDADGFYAAPSVGLKNSLQSYLNERKGVTQTVSVTSGARAIVKAKVTLKVGVLQGFSENVVRTAVLSAMDGLLKGREFGVSLYVSDITNTVLPVAGVSYVNVTIDGYLDPLDPAVTLTAKIDAFGNLIIDTSEVISKAVVTVTTVLRA
jgi:hypothetical protein